MKEGPFLCRRLRCKCTRTRDSQPRVRGVWGPGECGDYGSGTGVPRGPRPQGPQDRCRLVTRDEEGSGSSLGVGSTVGTVRSVVGKGVVVHSPDPTPRGPTVQESPFSSSPFEPLRFPYPPRSQFLSCTTLLSWSEGQRWVENDGPTGPDSVEWRVSDTGTTRGGRN